jgi:hypothetical protein
MPAVSSTLRTHYCVHYEKERHFALGVLSLAKKYGTAAVDDACAAALDMGMQEYRFVRRYLERCSQAPLSLQQVDPLIRELVQYRDLIDYRTKEAEASTSPKCLFFIIAAAGLLCLLWARERWRQISPVPRFAIATVFLTKEKSFASSFNSSPFPILRRMEPNIERNAELIVKMLERRGVETRLLRVAGAPPLIYGLLRVPGVHLTIGIYAHHDGQAVDVAQWHSPPSSPVLRDATGIRATGNRRVATCRSGASTPDPQAMTKRRLKPPWRLTLCGRAREDCR